MHVPTIMYSCDIGTTTAAGAMDNIMQHPRSIYLADAECRHFLVAYMCAKLTCIVYCFLVPAGLPCLLIIRQISYVSYEIPALIANKT
jgi:hypothetical protein